MKASTSFTRSEDQCLYVQFKELAAALLGSSSSSHLEACESFGVSDGKFTSEFVTQQMVEQFVAQLTCPQHRKQWRFQLQLVGLVEVSFLMQGRLTREENS